MSTANHQTGVLSKWKHTSPEGGVCVMESASMLAGEAFTDRPVAVSPPIAALLRGYNDWLESEDDWRQTLYAYAWRAVGTAGGPNVEDERIDVVLAWGDDLWSRRRRSLGGWLTRPRRAKTLAHSRVRGPICDQRAAVELREDARGGVGGSRRTDRDGCRVDAGRPVRTDVPSHRTVPVGRVAAWSR